MPSYHFSLGNSADGPVGFCARVEARNKTQAAARLQVFVASIADGVKVPVGDAPGMEYLEVYFNAGVITTSDIDEVGG